MSLSQAESAPGDVELLLFDIGGTLYGVDASQVLRIDRADADAIRLDVLGQLTRGLRALSFQTSEGEKQLKVDAVHGIRTVELGSLRRLPAAANTLPFAIGVWLDGEKPVLLLDLSENLQAQGR
jgi:chemotaxis signal transduction protein